MAINDLRLRHPLSVLLIVAGMARSSFYYHVKQLKAKYKYSIEKKIIADVFHELTESRFLIIFNFAAEVSFEILAIVKVLFDASNSKKKAWKTPRPFYLFNLMIRVLTF